MIINKIIPQSFCNGVKNALKILDTAIIAEDVKKPIYLLGAIIHNQYVIDKYNSLGVIILDDTNKSRLELIEDITSGTIILSAHGTPIEVIKRLKEKNIDYIDAICPNVSIAHDRIKKHLSLGYDIIYIGIDNHPESKAILSISKDIHFITNKEELSSLQIKNKKIYVTNQTTLSINDLRDLFDYLENKYPFAIIDNKICLATYNRQNAILNMPKCDLCIIVGDPKSSNTKRLAYTSTLTGANTILCKSYRDLDIEYIKNNYKVINISSGASTPSYLVDEIIKLME